MKVIQVDSLVPGQKAEEPLYDPATGEMLVAAGKRVTSNVIQTMRSLGFERILAVSSEEEIRSMRRSIRYSKVPLTSIEPDTAMASDLYDEEGRFLVAKGTKLSALILSSLARRHIQAVYQQRTIDSQSMGRVQKVVEAVSEDAENTSVFKPAFKADEIITDPKAINPRSVELMAKQMELGGKMDVEFDPKEGLSHQMRRVDPMIPREESRKREFVDIYSDLLEKTRRLYDKLENNVDVSSTVIVEMCSHLVNAMVRDRELLLCSMFINHDSEYYLAQHSLNVAIIAINIATAHGYSHKMVVEVGYGALLADVGMLRVPADIRQKTDQLNSLDINELKKHTIYGMDRLQLVRDLPRTTPLVAYQTHERLDGTGYPHRKRNHAIHDYAKIVAVADVYHAMIARRPFKQEVLIPYRAMEELLAMGRKGKLDQRFIRSLLASVSLFPVASWVRLNTGEIARVLQAKENLFTKPVVIVMYDGNGRPCEPVRIDLENDGNREVAAAVKVEDDDALAGF